ALCAHPGAPNSTASTASLWIMLFELRDDGVLLSADQGFRVGPIAQIESSHAGLVRIHGLVAAWCRGLEVPVLQIEHHHILVMEVHWGRDPGSPGVVPNDHTGVLDQLLAPRSRKCEGLARLICEWLLFEILKPDQNAGAVGGVLIALFEERRVTRARYPHRIVGDRICCAVQFPDLDALVINRLGRLKA